MLNADGTDIAEDAEVGPINLLLNSLFSQVEVTLNERLISYLYRAVIETLLSYTVATPNGRS